MNAPEPRGVRAWAAEEPAPTPLQFGSDPFVARSGGNPIGHQIQIVLAEVLRHLEARSPLVVVSGAPGTGKSWLLDKLVKVCAAKGVAARREDRGDLIDAVLADTCDALLVDEADSVTPELLEQLMEAGGFRKKRRSIVLMCLPGSVSRFDRVGRYPLLVQLKPLSEKEAHEFLEAGAKSIGRGSLFAPEAAQLVIEGSGGSPRLLRRNASLAYFAAASDGQCRISAEHVSQAVETHNFAPAGQNPNAGKSWTTSDPSDHSALYQKAPAPSPPPGEPPRPATNTTPAVSSSTPAAPSPGAGAPARSTPVEQSAEHKRPVRKLSEFALYASTPSDYHAALERLRVERNAEELEKIKRRETNRIFHHSWRFGK